MHIYSLSRKEIHGATAKYQSRLPRPVKGWGRATVLRMDLLIRVGKSRHAEAIKREKNSTVQKFKRI